MLRKLSIFEIIKIIDGTQDCFGNPVPCAFQPCFDLYPLFYIWLHGEELTGELCDKYKQEIEEKKLSWTKHWLNYEKLGGIKKFKMTAWLFAMLVRYVFIKTGRVAFKKYLQSKNYI